MENKLLTFHFVNSLWKQNKCSDWVNFVVGVNL